MGNSASASDFSPEKSSETTSFQSGTKTEEGPKRNTLSWERDCNDFRFLKLDLVCKRSDIGVHDEERCLLSVYRGGIVATTKAAAILYDICQHTIRQLPYPVGSHHRDILHSLSPDGKILIRWIWEDKNSDSCLVEAIRADSNTQLGQLPGTNMCSKYDAAYTVWVSNTVVYMPSTRQGIITRWLLEEDNTSISLIRPLSTVTRHDRLRVHLTKDERWWVVNGQTFNGKRTSGSGLIQVHNVVKNESKQIPGTVCCLGEVEVYDHKKTLLFISDAKNGRLSLKIQQLDPQAPGKPFEEVDISEPMRVREDCPWMLVLFEGLPIVAIVTGNYFLHFFEIHIGVHLFSQKLDMDTCKVFGDSDDSQSLLLYRHRRKTLHRVSVNTEDLIGYIRQVLQNDTLASAVAIRTGLPGAEDIIIHDMHAQYKDTAIDQLG
ncbi:hypothetical protein FRC02_005731 [Tulasnella sp. 418]|nr:hypothetical protein FRC02_005731 [Tulasnella sp. 418]